MSFTDLVGKVVDLVDILVYVIIGLSVVVILWGIVRSIAQADSKEGRTKARDRIVWGIVGLFVAISVWGLVNFVLATFS